VVRKVIAALAIVVLAGVGYLWLYVWPLVSHSQTFQIHTDVPYECCIDVVTGKEAKVSSDGSVRLQVHRESMTAEVVLISPTGTYRGKVHCHTGVIRPLPPLPYAAETVSGPGAWSLLSTHDLYLEVDRPGTCAVTVCGPSSPSAEFLHLASSAEIHWVSVDKGDSYLLGCNLSVQGDPGWKILGLSQNDGPSIISAPVSAVASIRLVDSQGSVTGAVRVGGKLLLALPGSDEWLIEAESSSGSLIVLKIRCTPSWSHREIRLTPP